VEDKTCGCCEYHKPFEGDGCICLNEQGEAKHHMDNCRELIDNPKENCPYFKDAWED
jgi:hypothetical protein